MKAALPRFRKARELNPGDPRAALYLGLTVESLGQPAEAMSLYEEAVRLERSANDLHAETLLPGAKLLFLLGRLDECERWLTQAAKLSPNSRDVHFEFARLLLEKGDAERAAAEGETRACAVGGNRDGRGDPLSADSSLPKARNGGSRGDAGRDHAYTGKPGRQHSEEVRPVTISNSIHEP